MDRLLTTECASLRQLKTAWVTAGPSLGPILYFIHGYPDTPQSWDHQLKFFSDRYQVVAPFARGASPSESSRHTSRYGLHSQALDHIAILNQIDPTKSRSIILVGHDLGAAQCWFLAPMLGARLKSMIILNGLSVSQMAARLKDPKQHLRSWYIYGMLTPLAPRILRRFSGQLVNFAHRLGKLAPQHRPSLSGTVNGAVNPAKQYKAYVGALSKTLNQGAPRIKAPVLLLWGKDDPFLLAPKTSELTPFAENATIRILEGNHWIHREHPNHVNRLINEFLNNA